MIRLEEIRARADAATAGPWESVTDYGFDHEPAATRWWGCGPNVLEDQSKIDADFIAAAREDIPWLLARVEELKEVTREAAKCLPHFASRASSALAKLEE